MKTITIDGKSLRVPAPHERALRTLKLNDFVAPKDAFVEGMWCNFILPRWEEWETFGISEEMNGVTKNKRAVKFFANQPRRRLVILGNARRINAILTRLDEFKKDKTTPEVTPRRYLVGEIGGSPAWGSGIVDAWGCKYKESAMKLFQRRVESKWSGAMEVFVFDRETRKLIARRNKSTPKQDKEFISWYIRS
jgi:hypothetical protein